MPSGTEIYIESLGNGELIVPRVNCILYPVIYNCVELHLDVLIEYYVYAYLVSACWCCLDYEEHLFTCGFAILEI